MKAFHRCIGIAVAAAIFIGAGGVASAQPAPPVIRGDAAATIGWLSVNTRSSAPYDNQNWVSSLYGAASAGWHWTDNLKTEIDFGAGTEARAYSGGPIAIGGRVSYVPIESRFSRRTLGLSQQYQFFHNVWFHPHVAAGANFTWDRRTDEIGPIYFYDDVARTNRIVESERIDGPRTSLTVRPFVAVGYKAYVTQRAFFRNDLRVAFRGGPDETVLRVGFGFDF